MRGGLAGGEKGQDAVGSGGAIAAEVVVFLAGFVCVEFGGGKKEAAVGGFGVPRVEVLAAFDKDGGGRERRVGVSHAGGAQGVENVAGHGEIDVAGIGRRAAAAAHAPCTVDRVGGMPAVLLGELLPTQIGDHGSDLRLPVVAAGAADRADRESSGVVRVIGDVAIGGAQGASRPRVIPNEDEGAIDLIPAARGAVLRDLQQGVKHEWRERLARAEQAVGVAMPTAVGLLAGP